MAGPLAPVVGTLVRWFLIGVVASAGWKLGSYALGKLSEEEWKDLKHTWTGKPESPPGTEQGN